MNQVTSNVGIGRPHRPASLDIGTTRRCPPAGCTRAVTTPASIIGVTTPLSAPAACTSRGFFDDGCIVNSNGNNSGNAPSGFELNVNVACSPAGNRGTKDGCCVVVLAIFNAETDGLMRKSG
jgi:hypothetical protein